MVKSEKLFLDKFADKNKTYTGCIAFVFKNGDVYIPDFFCVEDNQYIEIVGTPSQYIANAHKYIKMEIDFPKINFTIINVSKTKLPSLKELKKDELINIRVKHFLKCPQCDSSEIRIVRKKKISYCRKCGWEGHPETT